jgi:nitrite reductase/ring-hydroxylating ferredoxin subunit
MHKRRFSLQTGACHAADVASVRVWPVRVVGERLEIDMAAAAEGRAA